MRVLVAVTVALALLAGCLSGPQGAQPADIAATDPEEGREPVRAAIASPPQSSPWELLADGWSNFTNPLPPPPFGAEVDVATFEVPDGLARLTANFTRHHSSVEPFADNCRLYRGDHLETQAAFSDAQYGNISSDGTCDLEVTAPDAGQWRAVYLTDALDPMGIHEVHAVVMGLA